MDLQGSLTGDTGLNKKVKHVLNNNRLHQINKEFSKTI